MEQGAGSTKHVHSLKLGFLEGGSRHSKQLIIISAASNKKQLGSFFSFLPLTLLMTLFCRWLLGNGRGVVRTQVYTYQELGVSLSCLNARVYVVNFKYLKV